MNTQREDKPAFAQGSGEAKSQNSKREEEVLKFWKQNDTFNKSLTKDAPKGNYVFYDGPPFATGLPHYGHILGSTAKDVIGRYQTMQGFHVPRRWGWDCHGLPIENIVEKDLGISGKVGIEEFGIEKFTEHARTKVLTYVHEWKKTVDRIGRWVDFDNSYKTMDNTFIESVWWALGELHSKELLYEGVRVLAYCPRCETPIANSEIAMDNSYKDITDISVYVKFAVKNEVNTYLLAWTTTPWTLPGNTAIAVNKDIDYVYVKNGEEVLILAKNRFEALKEKFENPEIIKEIKGSELVGLEYEPVFDYYKEYFREQNKENTRPDEYPFGRVWKVWHADFVTADQGTGIAHEAPAFGEDDMNLAKEHGIPFIRHVEPNGYFTKEVTDFPDTKAKPKEDHQATDVLVIKYLAHKGLLFAKEKIIHSYPHCYRCETPLLYYALPSWFVNIQKIKSHALKNAEKMNWIPAHLKEGRFKHIMEGAPDWTISRNRYWASPLPFWKSESGKLMIVSSLEDLKKKTKKSGNKYFFARHGEAESNVARILNADVSVKNNLTEKGINTVKESAEKIKHEKVDMIISSPLMRTRQTAEIIAEVINFPKEKIIIDERIRELGVGLFEGRPVDEFHGFINAINDDIEYFSVGLPDSGESQQEMYKRVGDFIYELESKYSNTSFLIVSHGDPTMAVSMIARGFEIDNIRKQEKEFEYFKPGEIREVNFTRLPHNANYELDLHRPYIDDIILVDDKGVEYKRIEEVIDCWFESGSMPFAQDHYPFERPNWKKENFPAGFVAEYIAQTRTWFYYTHILSSILFDHAPFQNVVTTGTILAEDGSKMSKSKNNYPDPWILFDKYGVDALRFYLMSCPVMKGEDVAFSEKTVQEIASKIVGRLDNVTTFYELYRDKSLEGSKVTSTNALDKWILSRLSELTTEVTDGMEAYDMALATRPFELFVEDLSTWYLRRSRDRLKDGDKDAKATLYHVLKTTVTLLAPFAPFITEDIWQRLKRDEDAESVHLSNWPEVEKDVDRVVLEEMEQVRAIVTLGLEARQKANIKVRQPLAKLTIKEHKLTDVYKAIIKEELNVKSVVEGSEFDLDTKITEELKKEGEYRELVRAVQDMRKKMGLQPADSVEVTLSENTKDLVEEFMKEFQKTVGAKNVVFADNDGEEVKIDKLSVKIKIEKC